MKALVAILMLAVAQLSSACTAEQTQEPAKPTTEETAKKSESKKVCIKVYDANVNKEVEKCRTMKIHEKHEGTKVPEKK